MERDLLRWQRIGAWILGAAATAVAVWGRTWPFDRSPRDVASFSTPSVWQDRLSDRVTLGFARLALAFGAMFLVASVVALVLAGRWMSRVGGLSIDERESAGERVSALEARVRETEALLEEEAQKRQEAEGWVDTLLGDLDELG